LKEYISIVLSHKKLVATVMQKIDKALSPCKQIVSPVKGV